MLTMSTSAHLTSRLENLLRRSAISDRASCRACCDWPDARDRRPWRCGCGGILCQSLQRSPVGGSTLMTSAPKSDRITAAPGTRDEARQVHHLQSGEDVVACHCVSSSESSCAALIFTAPGTVGARFSQEGGRALLLVLGRGAEAEVGSFEQQALALARLQSFVRRLERELDGDRSVGSDLASGSLRRA